MVSTRDSPAAWEGCLVVLRAPLLLASASYLDDIRSRLLVQGISKAVRSHNTGDLFGWIVRLLARQGISNRAAEHFLLHSGSPTFKNFGARLARDARCPRLQTYWHYADCGFRRGAATCNVPHHLVGCPVSTIPARKGALAQAAIGLWLFVRDICDGDIVGWIDARLAAADPGYKHSKRAKLMQQALLIPLTEIPGTGSKVWSMILAELLLGADPNRERWITTGAAFIAIDSLVHNFLHRTGMLRRLDAGHAYGPKCYAAGGCADVIRGLAARIDAREFGPAFPRVFPRFVQFAIWQFCAEGGLNICNGRRIDDRRPCTQVFCPSYRDCARLPLRT